MVGFCFVNSSTLLGCILSLPFCSLMLQEMLKNGKATFLQENSRSDFLRNLSSDDKKQWSSFFGRSGGPDEEKMVSKISNYFNCLDMAGRKVAPEFKFWTSRIIAAPSCFQARVGFCALMFITQSQELRSCLQAQLPHKRNSCDTVLVL